MPRKRVAITAEPVGPRVRVCKPDQVIVVQVNTIRMRLTVDDARGLVEDANRAIEAATKLLPPTN